MIRRWLRQQVRLWHPDHGQAVPFGAAAIGLALVLTIAVGALGRDIVDTARARTAADAAALAAVEGGATGAHRMASANGATLVEMATIGRDVVVTVRVGEAVATARATGGETTATRPSPRYVAAPSPRPAPDWANTPAYTGSS